ncbi:steroid delta-isomerase [bacterium 336/3]|nr:steroid delta-isomerase [bacterium 336/3]
MKKLFLLCSMLGSFSLLAQKNSPTDLAQQQLKAYNQRNIEAFLEPYSDSVKVYEFPNKLMYKGKETMRKSYAEMFKSFPELNCTLKSRVVVGNTVIDEEKVFIKKGTPLIHAVAIYKIALGKIQEVYFISEK